MAGCLACKSCAGQCPVKVNVPEFRSRFLELYHQRYLRPLRDYLIGSLEFTMPWMARVPALYNGLMRSGWVRAVLERHVGMVDSPLLSRFDLAAVIRQWQVKPADPQALAALSDAQRARSVVIVQDTFTRYFDTEQLATLIELAARMGFQVWLAPLAPNGKALHVQGFLRAFEQAAIRNATQLAALARSGVALVGLDPAMTLTYRQEYLKVTGHRCAESCATAGVVAAGVAGGWYWRRCRRRAHVVPVTAALHREDQCARQRQAMGPGIRAARAAVEGPGDRVLRDVGYLRARGAQSRDVEDDLRAVVGVTRGRAGGRRRGAGDRLFVPQPGEADVVEAGAAPVAGAARSHAGGGVIGRASRVALPVR